MCVSVNSPLQTPIRSSVISHGSVQLTFHAFVFFLSQLLYLLNPMASGQNLTMRYDVFLSFRGEDTRYSITDHLYDRLLRAGLRTFRDNDAIDRGQELKPEIETAIIESRASIVVLSENYAKSRWCLDELWLILEQRRKCNHFVLPVFYHVDPSDVRNQTRSFAIEGSKWILDDVRRWKAALTEVANLTGLVLSGSETEFIAKVVHTVSCKLDLKHLSTPAHLTGMETRAELKLSVHG
ncbi:putative TIR domain-containing protein [Helianthus anomalus]